MTNKDEGIVNIHGKQYFTVARRIVGFRSIHPDYGIHTQILSIDANTVVVKATITDETGREISSGIAEEIRSASRINQTSAVENGETSAVGRALAFFGMAGTEIASADEVAGAIEDASRMGGDEYLTKHMIAARDNWDTIHKIKEHIANKEYEDAATVWGDVTESQRVVLWRAPTKGGIWTSEERELMDKEGAIARILAARKKAKAEAA
jgi:hypothetical protein